MSGRQSGQLMIIVAVGMVAFLGFAALAVDLGRAYSQRRLAQNAADFAGMAAIRMVRMSSPSTAGSVIFTEITRVATLNGAATVDSANTVFLDVNRSSLGSVASYAGSLNNVAGVRVKTQIQHNTFFAGVVGTPTLTATGSATAMSLAISGVTGSPLRPVAAMQEAFAPGTEYSIWDSDKEAAGNAGWVDFNGGANSASELEDWITNGFRSSESNPFRFWEGGTPSGSGEQDPTLYFPSWLEADTGNKSSLQSAVEALVGTSITIVVYDSITGSGSNAKYQVVGLAQFTITSVSLTGSPKYIRGTYEQKVLPGDPSATPTTSSMSTVRLTN